MIKLIIQIPCLNESETLPNTLARLPRHIEGIDTIEYLVIDDGSSDDTAGIAKRMGAHHVMRHRCNRGLAAAFRTGIDGSLAAGADIIVNTDGDGQYEGEDIAKLVAPIVAGEADVVVGDRGVARNLHFSWLKRLLQRTGSGVVQSLAGVQVPDAVSGFRALSREAAQKINITTEFSYTTDMLIQAGRKRLALASVPVRTHKVDRPSRLFSSIPRFITHTGITMIRTYTTHNPLRVFCATGLAAVLLGLMPIVRFLYFWTIGEGEGHIQSLVLGAALLILGVFVALMGVLADLISTNRKLLETTIVRLRELEHRQRKITATSSDHTDWLPNDVEGLRALGRSCP